MGHQMLTLEIASKGVEALMGDGGGLRIQREPVTDKHGPVHSSTATVAVIGASDADGSSPCHRRSERDFQAARFSGIGCGGQRRNRNASTVDTRPEAEPLSDGYAYSAAYSLGAARVVRIGRPP